MPANVFCFQFRGKILRQQARTGYRTSPASPGTGAGLLRRLLRCPPLSNTGINNTAKGIGA